MSNCCPACGQPVLPATGLGLSPTQWRIYEALRKRPGLTAEQLRRAIWCDREDGGPESRSAFHNQIVRMNKRLLSRGLRVKAHRVGASGLDVPTWRILHIEQHA